MRQPMEQNNFIKVKISYIRSIQGFLTRKEVSHFGEPIDDNEDGIEALLCSGHTHYEVHADHCSRAIRDQERLI